jgi:alpha-methylacyl-CoA racemase
MGPLEGFKVLEIGGPPGAFAGMMLSDHGADVLKISRPHGGGSIAAGIGHSVDPMGRGRRSVGVDLRHDQGPEVFLRLVREADALIEGFRPGVMERLGTGPAACLAESPHLVYARLTGWGQDGPWAQRAGHDVDYVALSGTLDAIGERDGPPIMPLNLLGDWAGGLLCAFGVVSALHQAARTGRGVVVDAAMLDTAALLGAVPHAMSSRGAWQKGRAANMVDGGHPYYSIYRTKDDKYVAVGAIEPQFYAQLIERLDLGDADLPEQMDATRWDETRAAIADAFATRTRDDWCDAMEGADACFAPVLDFAEARNHPHNRARGLFVDFGGVVQPAPAPRFDGTVSPIRSWDECDVPEEQVLSDWGLGADEVTELLACGAVAVSAP